MNGLLGIGTISGGIAEQLATEDVRLNGETTIDEIAAGVAAGEMGGEVVVEEEEVENGDLVDAAEEKEKFKDSILSPQTKETLLYCIYLIAILVWILVIVYLKLYIHNDAISTVIVIVPILFFMFNIWNAQYITPDLESRLFQVNVVSISLLIVIPLLTWTSRNFNGDYERYMGIIVWAIIFALLTLVDVWVRPQWISITKHIKSVFETMAIFLVIYATYSFYMHL